VISVYSQVFIALLCKSAKYSFQNSLRRRVGANLVYDRFTVWELLWVESTGRPDYTFPDLRTTIR
jgi:hypothetical protein